MSEYDAKKIREERKKKAEERGGGENTKKVDASDWTPAEPLNTEAKTGQRPVSKRQYKRGGHVEGKEAHKHAGKKPRMGRKDGGKADSEVWDSYMNRDGREANHEIAEPHEGGFKRGGRMHRDSGGQTQGANPVPTSALNLNGRNIGAGALKKGGRAGHAMGGHPDEKQDRKLVDEMVKKDCRTGKKHGGEAKGNYEGGTRPTGGRLARKDGGRSGKGKTNIIISVNPHGQGQDMQQGAPMMRPPAPPPSPVPMAPPGGAGMPPPQGGAGMPMPPSGAGAPPAMGGAPGMLPPGIPPQLPRKSGGRTERYEGGAGGGEGRLQKIKNYGLKPPG